MEEAQYRFVAQPPMFKVERKIVWLWGLDGFDDADKGQKLKHITQTIM